MPRTEEMPKVKEIKGKKWDEWIDKQFKGTTFYYSKKRRYITVICSHCGQMRVIDRYDPFDDGDYVKHGSEGRCAVCKAKGIYRSIGKARPICREWITVLTAEKHGDAVLFRVFDIERRYIRGKKSVTLDPNETDRILMRKDKAAWRWRNCYYGGWNRGNESRNTYFGDISSGIVHESVWRTIRGSYMKYFGIRRCFEEMPRVRRTGETFGVEIYRFCDIQNVLQVCAIYSYYPMLESLDKIGGYRHITRKVIYGSIKLNKRERTPWGALGIYRSRMKPLSLDNSRLDIYQKEKKTGAHWNDEEVKYLESLGSYWNRETAYKLTDMVSLIKQNNYLKKQKERSIGRWYDYLQMKRELGYEMDSIAIYPKDLEAAHARCIEEKHANEAARKAKEKEATYKSIRTNAKKLNAKYGWKHGKMTIRIARNATEFINEGRALHHCVAATDRYLKRHAEGSSYILFLRYKADEPYITVELSRDCEVMQWFGAYDRKPEEEKIEKWLKEYTEHLLKDKGKKRKKGAKAS